MTRSSIRCWKTASLATLALGSVTASAQQEASSNPITKLSRIIDPELITTENQVSVLDNQLATLARYHQFPLKYGIGYRGCRSDDNAPDPTIVMDLGKELPINTIYLVPVQSQYLNDYGIFPLRFTVDISSDPEFNERSIVYTSGKTTYQQVKGTPMKLRTDQVGRYVRISIHQGHNRFANDIFGLSEFMVLSGQDPVSFNSKITTTGSLDVPGIWYQEALIDGRMPLGVWQNGHSLHSQQGDAVIVEDHDTPVSWQADLPEACEIDRIILFPYNTQGAYETSILPESLKIQIQGADSNTWETIYEWSNPVPGTNQLSPLVAAFDPIPASKILVTGTTPWSTGQNQIYALSEIEVWSERENKIANQTLIRTHGSKQTHITDLTDGKTSEKAIAPVGIWLNQLFARKRIEDEIKIEREIYRKLSSQAELNVFWGSAVMLGLTFLIPVYIFERRRMKSREHIDIIRKRIASDLHDDIGSNLGSISLIARTARKDLARMQGPKELDDDLGEVENIARESSLAMRDIVWLLERKQDSIGDLIHRMRETAGRLLREIQFTLECNSTKTTSKLSLDAKRHLFLFYKEAIHNVLKHSQATQVSIKLWDEGEKLALEIQDNGIGLPITKDKVPAGVKKLATRAEVLGGTFNVTSSAETGTCVRLVVKRSHLTIENKQS